MKAYRILVRDRRTPAQMEWAAEMASDARAVEFARDRLAGSDTLSAIEVWSGPMRLCRFGEELRKAA